jgi:thymidylate synthase (FAD)
MHIPVLSHGYIRLVDKMGSDLSVVNGAKISYSKESEAFGDPEARLVRFLTKEVGAKRHSSPFRHAIMSFEIYAPLMVARQWWKYVVGSDHTMDGWNESSRRYVTEVPQYYVVMPVEWRSAPESSKQGSGGPISYRVGEELTGHLLNHYRKSTELYDYAISQGVCVEQARVFLCAYALFVRWRWTASLNSILHVIDQRLADDAQKEFQEYAEALSQIVKSNFPHAYSAWVENSKT